MNLHNSPQNPDQSDDLTLHDLEGEPPTSGRQHRSGTAFRFLQASDFRLDTPCLGTPNLSGELENQLRDARFEAARRVFDAAIEQDVDFVVLAGGLLDPRLPGLRGPWFLAEQFRRLADHGIRVYWSGATFESRGRWPAHIDVPANVHRLNADETGILHGNAGQPIARLVTFPAAGKIPKITGGAFTIAVQPRCAAAPEHWGTGIDFWALGGQSDHETIQVGDVVAHFAGSPQGRSPLEPGRHSCSVVTVEGDRSVQIQPINTDVIRWHHQRLEIDGDASWSDLEERLDQELNQLRHDSVVSLKIVEWTISGGSLAVQRLLQPRFNNELIQRLNNSNSNAKTAVWTTSIVPFVELQQRREWQNQKSPLGAFLRELDDAADHIQELFGTTADSSPTEATVTNDDIIQRVRNEGVFWLGTDDHQSRRAA